MCVCIRGLSIGMCGIVETCYESRLAWGLKRSDPVSQHLLGQICWCNTVILAVKNVLRAQSHIIVKYRAPLRITDIIFKVVPPPPFFFLSVVSFFCQIGFPRNQSGRWDSSKEGSFKSQGKKKKEKRSPEWFSLNCFKPNNIQLTKQMLKS